MFKDGREFRAVSFYDTTLSDLHDIRVVFPKHCITHATRIPSDSSIDVYHMYYRSKERFLTPKTPETRDKIFEAISEEVKVGRTKQTMYRYDMYVMRFMNPSSFFVCVPFYQMAQEVFWKLHTFRDDARLSYLTINLSVVLSALRTGRTADGQARLIGAALKVEGDTNVRQLVLSGQDVLHNDIYDVIEEKGTRLEPSRFKLAYTQTSQSERITVVLDNWGNYRFHVTRDGSNVPVLADVLAYAESVGALEKSNAYPLLRGAE